jgi:hypothetical protein
MHPRTKATLEDAQRAQWFNCVGIRDTEAAVVLSSWGEAIESCNSLDWENLCLEAANQYCERLIERSRERFNQWNVIVREMKPFAESLAREKTASVIAEFNLPKIFFNRVCWDILHLIMESEYADVYPPGFYASHAYWYVKGHFPCGWSGGQFPKGKLVIY